MKRQQNPLEQYFRRNKGRNIHKWVHYFYVYDRHLSRFRGREITVVEFGVQFGGSMQMWQDYFGPKARFIGVDIDPRCRAWADERTTIMIGDQADRSFLREIVDRAGTIDIVIEDGGHRPQQQIATFEEMYPRMAPDGVFLIEDLHTSYWPSHDGGLGRAGTFMEYAKPLTDQLNAFHSREDGFAVDEFTRTTRSVHYYDSIIVFERGEVTKPHVEKTGVMSWNPADHAGAERERARAEKPLQWLKAKLPEPVRATGRKARRATRRQIRRIRQRVGS